MAHSKVLTKPPNHNHNLPSVMRAGFLGVMKNKQQTTTILTALAYLIDRQGLSPAEIKEIVIKTATELEQ